MHSRNPKACERCRQKHWRCRPPFPCTPCAAANVSCEVRVKPRPRRQKNGATQDITCNQHHLLPTTSTNGIVTADSATGSASQIATGGEPVTTGSALNRSRRISVASLPPLHVPYDTCDGVHAALRDAILAKHGMDMSILPMRLQRR